MNTNDRYCPNCRQMVQPKRHQNIIGFISGLFVWLIVIPALLPAFGVADWVGQWWFTALGWAAIALSALAALKIVRSCPICKTVKLEEQAPAPTV